MQAYFPGQGSSKKGVPKSDTYRPVKDFNEVLKLKSGKVLVRCKNDPSKWKECLLGWRGANSKDTLGMWEGGKKLEANA